jgi:hypothetical protein
MTAVLDLHPTPGHPAAVVAGVHEALDSLSAVDDDHVCDFSTLVAECARARARLQALELKLVSAADRAKVPARSGARNAGAWLATTTRSDQAASARDVRLAADLHDSLPATAAAFEAGELSAAHAHVVADALRRLPEAVTPAQRTAVEASLADDARRLGPKALRRRARRALDVIEADEHKVDAHENELVEDEESRALARTRLTLHDNADGTLSGHFTVPLAAGAILRKVLDALTSPRRGRGGATLAQAGDQSIHRDPAHDRGLAFVQILEHLPTDRLHHKVAATLLVRLDHATLQGQLKAAGLDTGDLVSASEARRLACQAGVLPAVLGGESQPLDLGHTRRFFSGTQRAAGALRHTDCAADGCDIPYAWCELHHREPWSTGGPTDLDQMVPLCGFHHRRIHDRWFEHRHRSDGSITFHRRT